MSCMKNMPYIEKDTFDTQTKLKPDRLFDFQYKQFHWFD